MIQTLRFGRTGHLSTRTLFGAAGLGNVSQDEADATLETLLQYGINHIDTAASYGNAEERIGPWMREHRQSFFLATKTGERTYDKAKAQIHRSLDRLRVSQVDLLQLHCLIEENEWETAMGPGGALEAAIEAREAGLVRFIGVTGHGLNVARMHLKSLARFDFDTVLLPWNFSLAQNADYAREFAQLCELCRERDVPVQTIKSVAQRKWEAGEHASHATWYKPLDEQPDIDRALGWVWKTPDLFLNTVGDIHILPLFLNAANRGDELESSDEAMAELMERQGVAPIFA